MRRNDHDVTDRVRTTDLAAVRAAVRALFFGLYEDASARPIARAFREIDRLYRGEHPGYCACDTQYHDLQHVLDVTLAMARLMDGYERSRVDTAALGPELFQLGVVAALFHDVGYLRRRADRRHRYGAEYTLVHVSRGGEFLRRYLARLGLGRHAAIAAELLHFTGYERAVATLRVPDPLLRHVGHMLGTADIIAQMSDRCYLEKCRDRLYPEFVLGGVARRMLPSGRTQIAFRSGEDLVRKTPRFFRGAAKRLEVELEGAYEYAREHFGGQNLYLDEMQKNVRFASVVAQARDGELLRRTPPDTLEPGVEPYPKELALR